MDALARDGPGHGIRLGVVDVAGKFNTLVPGARAFAYGQLEAALIWMFYISAFAESNSCFEDLGDCDSASGYYSGSRTRDDVQGLASYIKARSPQAHEAVWDGLLAIQCWRDLDAAIPPAKPELQDQAKQQFDRALLRGMALIVRQKVVNIDCPEAAIAAKK